MPVDFERVLGYRPTLEELLEDLGIQSHHQMRDALLGRCRELYSEARESGTIATFENSPLEFILCDSSEFYQTIVNLGFGNPALTILDDYSPEAYFLMFTDKLPEQFREIAAAHESAEYLLVRSGTDQQSAHTMAIHVEMKTAEKLGLKQDYLRFIEENYPLKYSQLRAMGHL